MKMTAMRICFCSLGLFFFALSQASAHVKWFTDASVVSPVARDDTFHISDPAVLIGIGCVFVALLVAAALEYLIPAPSAAWKQRVQKAEPRVIALFRIVVGLWLLLTAYSGEILAPNMAVSSSDSITLVLQWAEALVGVWMLIGVALIPAAGVLIALWIASGVVFGLLPMVEHIDVVGIAAFIGLTAWRTASMRPWALPLLRVCTGAALIILAFSEKLFAKDLAIAFLSEHNWNFMQAAGLSWFTNEVFVLAAGLGELLFGMLFVFGWVTRINTIALSLFFVSTLFALGPTELIGHLPFFGIALMLIVYGSGKKLRLPIPMKTYA